MGIDFGGWLGGSGVSLVATQAPLRSQIQWSRILDKPDSLVLRREGLDLAPQTLRIELDNGIQDASSPSGDSTSRGGTLFGIKGHPTLPDSDIELWDTFVLDDVEYTVTQVNRQQHGVIQAHIEGVG